MTVLSAGPAPKGLAWFWAAWLGLGAAWAAEPAETYTAVVSVTVPPEKAVAGGERLLLGEVAFIEVLDPAGRDLAEALGLVDLGPAPAPGRSAVLRRDEIKKALLASGLDPRSATWNLPPELKVTAGENAAVSEEELRAALEKYLAANEPYQSGRFELVSLNLAPPPALAPGPVAFRFQPQASSSPVNISGHFIFSQNNRDVGRSRVTAQVDLSIPVLVAARALPRGQVLAAEDLNLTFLPYGQARGALNDPDQAVGGTLKTTLAAGTPLREQVLGRSLMVRKGDIVIISARQGPLNVTTVGEAKADGVLGDTITVINQSSKKNIRGRIVGPGRVEVIF